MDTPADDDPQQEGPEDAVEELEASESDVEREPPIDDEYVPV
jgi:hypothetical protein